MVSLSISCSFASSRAKKKMKLLQLFGVSATLLLIAHGQQQNPGSQLPFSQSLFVGPKNNVIIKKFLELFSRLTIGIEKSHEVMTSWPFLILQATRVLALVLLF